MPIRPLSGRRGGGTGSPAGHEAAARPRSSTWLGRVRRDPSPVPSIGSGFYPGLDLLRGVAATSVLVCHVIGMYRWRNFPLPGALGAWFRVGWIGLDLFFVISGLVIGLSALRLWERDRAGFVRGFASRRLARILPLYYMTCVLFLAFIRPQTLFRPGSWLDVLTHLTFTHNLIPRTTYSINNPSWSLGVEMQFYALVLLLTPWLSRRRPITVLFLGVAMSWLWRISALWAIKLAEIRNLELVRIITMNQLPGVLDEFGMGFALALWLHRDRDRSLAQKLNAARWLLPVATAGLGYVAMKLFVLPRGISFWTDWRMVACWRSLLGVCCLLAVLSACALNDRWFLVLTSPLRYLGTISYGIYLWHWGVLLALRPVIRDPGKACLWTLGLTILLAALSWHFFEKSFLRRLDGHGKRAVPEQGPHAA